MKNDDQVIERPVVEAQNVYDDLRAKRAKLNELNKMRNEALMAIPRYKKLSGEMSDAREARQKITLEHDEKESGHKGKIDTAKSDVELFEAKLGGLALEHFKKTGTKLQLKRTLKNGKVKVIEVGFAIRTMSLF